MKQSSLYREEAGQGPPVILVHGAMMDTRMWDEQFALLAQSFRTIRFDLPGFGRSPLPPTGFIHERDELRAVLDAAGVERAHVVGLSLGAKIAIDFALAYPHRVGSLVLTMGGLAGYPDDGWPDDLGRGFDALVAAAKARDFATATKHLLDLSPMRPAAANPAVRASLESILRDQSWAPLTTELTFDELNPPAGERIGDISVPVLVVQGDLEIESFRQMGRWVVERVPQGRLVEIAGAGHMVNMERPAEYNLVVLDFLRDVERAATVQLAS